MAAMQTGSQRIAGAFAGHGRSAALMPYMMGGFPDVEGSLTIANAYIDAGADLIEVGVPFSDPLADGPVIQAAGQQALAAGTTLDDVLSLVGEIADRVPVVAMCYANMVRAPGVETFVERLAAAGAAGLIVPDQPVDEAGELLAACDERGLALVPLAAPTTTDERLELIGERARGFVYLVSVAGVTGERGELPAQLPDTVSRVGEHTDLPIAVGFGIGTPQQAGAVAEIAAGVIIGSRLVRIAADADSCELAAAEIEAFLGETVAALS